MSRFNMIKLSSEEIIITSDEEIKRGDLYYCTEKETVNKSNGRNISTHKKIIGSSDKLLNQ